MSTIPQIDITSQLPAFKWRPSSFYSQISTNKTAGIKCQFCLECFDLLDIFNVDTTISTYASVSVANEMSQSETKWALLGNTYVVKNNSNPPYHEKEFEINDVVLDKGYVLIQIYALHPANGMPVCIGKCQIPIKEMLVSDTVVRKLKCGFGEKGTVVVFMKSKKAESKSYLTPEVEYCSIADTCPDSVPSLITPSDEYKNTFFKDVLGNITRQRYHIKLRPQYEKSLHVSEEMFELSTSFPLPALYIRLLCLRENDNLLVLKDMSEGFSEELCSINTVSRTAKLEFYREELAHMGLISKHNFKKSEWKTHSEGKWAPVNLHAQLLEVNPLDLKTKSSCGRSNYCILTVGAMAGHWDKFKGGGLATLLDSEKTKDGVKFFQRRELYRILQNIEAILNSGDLSSDLYRSDTDTASHLIELSKEQVCRFALEELQKTLRSEKQLEFMNLSADLERIMKSIKVSSNDSLRSVCRSYCLHLQRAIVWTICQMELDNREHFLNILNRYDACFAQLLSAAVSGFIVSLCFRASEKIFLLQLAEHVVPIMFESLLSTHGDEAGMLEDMQFVIQHLGDIEIQLEADREPSPAEQLYDQLGDTHSQVRVSRITGSPCSVTVVISLPPSLLAKLPVQVQNQEKIKLRGLFFSHGINEQQTIAYKINETAFQDRICEQFLVDLQDYIDTHVTPNISTFNFKVANGLENDMEKLAALFKVTKKAKSSEFIVLAEQIGRDIGCIRSTSCKSAKDRTSMSVTYEYCNILCREHDCSAEDVPGILEQFRRDGTRFHNAFKNIGSYKYCFNKLQCKMLPGIYRPPPGTFGDGAGHS